MMQLFRFILVWSVLFAGCSSPRNTAPPISSKELVDLDAGMLDLPDGFSHTRGQGIDSLVGQFTSADGRLVIHYDIGFFAGVSALQTEGKDILSSSKVTVHDLTALIVVARWSNAKHVVVSFPKGGPANFYAEIRDDADLEAVLNLALNYRLKRDERE